MLSMAHAREMIRAAGGSELGRGLYSVVFQVENVAVKVPMAEEPWDHWLDWARACMGPLKGNPHVPVIYGLTVFRGGSYVALMEVLSAGDEAGNGTGAVARDISKRRFNSAEMRAVYDMLGTQWHEDLHPGNVMFRGSVPVVTDPWA